MNIDIAFLEGAAAAITSTLIFCGSVMFLLALVMGLRLAYFVTASITLGFVFLMGLVWSFTPLGPVGQLPRWDPVALADAGEPLQAPEAGTYPAEPWAVPAEDDPEETARASELESDAVDGLAAEIEAATAEDAEPPGGVTDPDQLQVLEESTRLFEQDGILYGALTFEPAAAAEGNTELGLSNDELKELSNAPAPSPAPAAEEAEVEEEAESTVEPAAPGTVVAVLQFNPGNVNGPARLITLGTLLLLGLHLFGLSRSEKRATLERERREGATA